MTYSLYQPNPSRHECSAFRAMARQYMEKQPAMIDCDRARHWPYSRCQSSIVQSPGFTHVEGFAQPITRQSNASRRRMVGLLAEVFTAVLGGAHGFDLGRLSPGRSVSDTAALSVSPILAGYRWLQTPFDVATGRVSA